MQFKLFNDTQSEVNYTTVKKIVRKLKKVSLKGLGLSAKQRALYKKEKLNLILKTPRSISLLNKELFRKIGPTDVISVNNARTKLSVQRPGVRTPLGDIYICPHVIMRNAKQFGANFEDELTRITIHGILHLLSMDHKKPYREKSREKMFRIQEEFLRRTM